DVRCGGTPYKGIEPGCGLVIHCGPPGVLGRDREPLEPFGRRFRDGGVWTKRMIAKELEGVDALDLHLSIALQLDVELRSAVAAHVHDGCRAADRRFIQLRRPAARKLPGHRPGTPEGPPPVDREHATEAAGEFAVRGEDTQIAFVAELALDPKHANPSLGTRA